MSAAEIEQSLLERQQSSAEAGSRPVKESSGLEVFDQEGFDAVAYINEMFPTGTLVLPQNSSHFME